MKNVSTGFSKAVLLFLALLFLCGLYLSGVWGVAAVSHSLAMNHFNSWQKHDKTPSKDSWQWTHDALELAFELDAKNAQYANDLGRFYEFSASNLEKGNALKPLYLEKSSYYFRRTTQLSPSWAVAWANLALLKHKMGQIDDELYFAVRQGLLLGGSMKPIQIIMAEVGVAHWFDLPIALRQVILKNLHYVLNSNYRFKIIENMRYYHMLPYFCLVFNASDKKKFCGNN